MLRKAFRTFGAVGASVVTMAILAVPALADSAAPVGPSSIGGALNGIQSLLYHLALPAAGVGLATGGLWHTLAHEQQGQMGAKTLMKGSLVGVGVTVLATAILSAFTNSLTGG